jgi:protein-L-isoaspartate(D-aspartate) O-methyltransferase
MTNECSSLDFDSARRRMVEEQLLARYIVDPDVLRVMGSLARERFVPESQRPWAYGDHPLPIGWGQTISQPYVTALMIQLARPTRESRVLEIGVGSGYQTAILAELCREVFGLEILRPLAESTEKLLALLGYRNVSIQCGDGRRGWPEHAPFDVILAGASPNSVPEPLIEQLAPGGRLVLPVGLGRQMLWRIEKRPDGSFDRQAIAPVQFVPMTGDDGETRISG